MRGPEEWPSRESNPADKIRLTDPAAKFPSIARCFDKIRTFVQVAVVDIEEISPMYNGRVNRKSLL
jgi:hypothetical protein